MRKKDVQRLKAQHRRRERTAHDLEELPLWPETVQGGKYIRELERVILALREVDPHGNRSLFLDDVFVIHLLAFFNASMRSLRKMEDFSKTQNAQRLLCDKRIRKSTLSDYHKFADADRLKPIIGHLRSMVSRRYAGGSMPSDLALLSKDILAVDGTFFTAAADVAWAVGSRNQYTGAKKKFKARLDVQLNVTTWLPEVISVPDPGESEAEAARQIIKPGAIHLYDRGYNKFALIADHYDQEGEQWIPRAEFVMRAQSNILLFDATQEFPLSDEQQKLGVVSDRIGVLRGSNSFTAPPVSIREVVLRADDQESEIRLLTNLLDVDVQTIGILYRYRWQIELFFRWLKCYAHFDHLISHSPEGVKLQFYVVIIGVLLMYLHTGGRPSTYALSLLALVARNAATLEEIIPILRERERQCQRDRQSAAKRRARKKAEAQ